MKNECPTSKKPVYNRSSVKTTPPSSQILLLSKWQCRSICILMPTVQYASSCFIMAILSNLFSQADDYKYMVQYRTFSTTWRRWMFPLFLFNVHNLLSLLQSIFTLVFKLHSFWPLSRITVFLSSISCFLRSIQVRSNVPKSVLEMQITLRW